MLTNILEDEIINREIKNINDEYDIDEYNIDGYDKNDLTKNGYSKEFVERINNMDLSGQPTVTSEELDIILKI